MQTCSEPWQRGLQCEGFALLKQGNLTPNALALFSFDLQVRDLSSSDALDAGADAYARQLQRHGHHTKLQTLLLVHCSRSAKLAS